MKHVKLFEQYRQQETLTLYHGTPYTFEEEKFKGEVIFLAENPRFAENYAYTKAQDMKLDANITIYKCELNANLFDIKNPDHSTKLYEMLPDWVGFLYSNGMKGELPKDEYIQAMHGIEIEKGFNKDLIKNKKIGSVFQYDGSTVVLVDIDEDYIYYMNEYYFYKGLERSAIKNIEEYARTLKGTRDVRKEYLHDKETTDNETWIYFEYWKVTQMIKNLGFDGYAATERNVTTYAIFNLNTIKILGKM